MRTDDLAVAWLTTTITIAASGSIGSGGGGVPMVDNSVAFAVDRCRQFLRLAEFMRASALRKDAGIRCVDRVYTGWSITSESTCSWVGLTLIRHLTKLLCYFCQVNISPS